MQPSRGASDVSIMLNVTTADLLYHPRHPCIHLHLAKSLRPRQCWQGIPSAAIVVHSLYLYGSEQCLCCLLVAYRSVTVVALWLCSEVEGLSPVRPHPDQAYECRVSAEKPGDYTVVFGAAQPGELDDPVPFSLLVRLV